MSIGRMDNDPSAKSRFPSIEVLESRIAPAVFMVTSSMDSGAGSLRAEVAAANGHPGANTIKFASSITLITVTSGVIDITGALTIAGPGSGKLTISGGNTSGIFDVTAGRGATFSGMALTDGNATSGSFPANAGGAINSDVSLTVNNCIFAGDTATYGGAIAVTGTGTTHATLVVNNAEFKDDTASFYGGAIYADVSKGSAAVVNRSEIGIAGSGNQAGKGGGGAYFEVGFEVGAGVTGGPIVLNDCSVAANSTTDISSPGVLSGGGGLFFSGAHSSIRVLNSNISGNTAKSYGGGVYVNGETENTNLIISGSSFTLNSTDNNTLDEGGALVVALNAGPSTIVNTSFVGNTSLGSAGAILLIQGGGTLTLTNAVVAGNTAATLGGGIQIDQGTLNLNSTSVVDNSATASGGGGGGIDVVEADAIHITASRILDNSAKGNGDIGGGILDPGAGGGNSLTVVSSLISSNSASEGAGIYAGTGTNPLILTIAGSTISYNSALGGGGLEAGGAGFVTLAGDVFLANSAKTGTGGAVSLSGTAGVQIIGGSFAANTSGAGDGGVTISEVWKVTITGTVFTQNYGADTGALDIENALFGSVVKGVTIVDNVSDGDASGAGGFSAGISVTLLASHIAGNINVGEPGLANTFGSFMT